MKEYLVDTNVILDVIGADHRFGPYSRSGTYGINPFAKAAS